MADQNISFKVTVNSKEAEDAFRKLASAQGAAITQSQKMTNTGNQSNMMLMSTSRIVQDLPYGFMAVGNNITFMVEQMAMARSQGMGFSAMLKGMLSSLAGPMGLVFLISTATSVLTMFAMSNRNSVKDIDGTTAAIKRQKEELKALFDKYQEWDKKAKDPATFMNAIARGELQRLQESRDSLKSQIAAISGVSGGTEAERFSRALLLTDLRSQLDVVNEKLSVIEASFRTIKSSATEAFARANEGVKSLGENAKTTIGFLSVLYGDMLNSLDRLSKTRRGGGGLQFAGQVPTPDKPIPNVFVSEAELKEYDAFLFTTMTATAQSVGNLFKGMWREIFGEANNLLTDFIGNIISSLADVAARGLAIDLLNLAFPGAGLIGGLGLFGSKQPAGGSASAVGQLQKSTNVYNINIGQQTVAQVVTEGYNTAVRLRKL